jgi:hypothetical protein
MHIRNVKVHGSLKLENNMDPQYPDAKELGHHDARVNIIKKKPRSVSDLIAIKKMLGSQINEKYLYSPKGCKIAYIAGVTEELRKHFRKLQAEET